MNKQRMVKMLETARAAVNEADLYSTLVQYTPDGNAMVVTEGTQNLIGQLMLASAIEESGSSVSLSIDKLDGLMRELGEIAVSIRQR